MITPPIPSQPVVENGLMRQEFMLWTQAVTKLQPIIGTGSPEGVVEAQQFSFYIDETGGTGSILYIKKLPFIGSDRKKGWILV